MLSAYWYGYLSAFGGQYTDIHIVSIIFELLFLIGMCINFVKQYTPDGETIPVKNLSKISMNYIKKGSFKTDFICLFPFPFLLQQGDKIHLWYTIKIYRVLAGLRLLDVKSIMDVIKTF